MAVSDKSVNKKIYQSDYKLYISNEPIERQTFMTTLKPFSNFVKGENNDLPPEVVLEVSGKEANNVDNVNFEIVCNLAAENYINEGIKLSPHLLIWNTQEAESRMEEKTERDIAPIIANMKRKENSKDTLVFTFCLANSQIKLSQSSEIETNLLKKYSEAMKYNDAIPLFDLEKRKLEVRQRMGIDNVNNNGKVKDNINEERKPSYSVSEKMNEVGSAALILESVDDKALYIEKVFLAFTAFKIEKNKGTRPKQIHETILSKGILNLEPINIDFCNTTHISINGGSISLIARDLKFDYEMVLREVNNDTNCKPCYTEIVRKCEKRPSENAMIYNVPKYVNKSNHKRMPIKCEILLRHGRSESNHVTIYYKKEVINEKFADATEEGNIVRSAEILETKKIIRYNLKKLKYKLDELDLTNKVLFWNAILSVDELYQKERCCNLYHDAVKFNCFDDEFFDCLHLNKISKSDEEEVIKQRLLDWCDAKGQTLLHVACESGNFNAVKELLKINMIGNAVCKQDYLNCDTPLHLAIRYQHHCAQLIQEFIRVISALEKSHFLQLINAHNQSGYTILHSAIMHNSLDLVEKLLESCVTHGINACAIEVLGSGDTILHLAIDWQKSHKNQTYLKAIEDMILKNFTNADKCRNYKGINAYGIIELEGDQRECYEYIIQPFANDTENLSMEGLYFGATNMKNSTSYFKVDDDVGFDYDVMYLGDKWSYEMRFENEECVYSEKMLPMEIPDFRHQSIYLSTFYRFYTPVLNHLPYRSNKTEFVMENFVVLLQVSSIEPNYFDNMQYVIWCELTTNNNIQQGLHITPHILHKKTDNFNREFNVEPIRATMKKCCDDICKDGRIIRTFQFNVDELRYHNVNLSNIIVNLEAKLKSYENLENQLNLGDLEEKMASYVMQKISFGESQLIYQCAYIALTVFEVSSKKNMLPVGSIFLPIFNIKGRKETHTPFAKIRVPKDLDKIAEDSRNMKHKTVSKVDSLLSEPFPKCTYTQNYLNELNSELNKAIQGNYNNLWEIVCRFNANYKRQICTTSTLFHDAVKVGCFHLVRLIADSINNTDKELDIWKRICCWRNWCGETLLHVACECDDFDVILALLRYYPSAVLLIRIVDGQRPLNISIRRHHPPNVIEEITTQMLIRNKLKLNWLLMGAITRKYFTLMNLLLKIKEKYQYWDDSVDDEIFVDAENKPSILIDTLLCNQLEIIFSNSCDSWKKLLNNDELFKFLQMACRKNYPTLAETLLKESIKCKYIWNAVDINEFEFYELFSSAIRENCAILTELLLQTHKNYQKRLKCLTHLTSYFEQQEISELQTFLQIAIRDNCLSLVELLLKFCKRRKLSLGVRLLQKKSFVQADNHYNKLLDIILKYSRSVILHDNIFGKEMKKVIPGKNQIILSVYKYVPKESESDSEDFDSATCCVKIQLSENIDDLLWAEEKIFWFESTCNWQSEVEKRLKSLLVVLKEVPESDMQEILKANLDYKQDFSFNNSLFHDAIIVDKCCSVIDCVESINSEFLKEKVRQRFSRWYNCRGETFLHVACEYGKNNAVKPLLVNFPQMIMHQTLVPRDTPLHLAIMNRNHHSTLIKEFLDFIRKMGKGELTDLLNKYNRRGQTVLHCAIIYNRFELVEEILKCCVNHGIDACAIEVLGSGNTILHLAVDLQYSIHGNDSAVNYMKQLVLKNYRNAVDYKNYEGNSACERCFESAVVHCQPVEISNERQEDNRREGFKFILQKKRSTHKHKRSSPFKPGKKVYLKQLEFDLRMAGGKDFAHIWNIFVRVNDFYQKEYNSNKSVYQNAFEGGYGLTVGNCIRSIWLDVIREDIQKRVGY